jgi:hypothetical protein
MIEQSKAPPTRSILTLAQRCDTCKEKGIEWVYLDTLTFFSYFVLAYATLILMRVGSWGNSETFYIVSVGNFRDCFTE